MHSRNAQYVHVRSPQYPDSHARPCRRGSCPSDSKFDRTPWPRLGSVRRRDLVRRAHETRPCVVWLGWIVHRARGPATGGQGAASMLRLDELSDFAKDAGPGVALGGPSRSVSGSRGGLLLPALPSASRATAPTRGIISVGRPRPRPSSPSSLPPSLPLLRVHPVALRRPLVCCPCSQPTVVSPFLVSGRWTHAPPRLPSTPSPPNWCFPPEQRAPTFANLTKAANGPGNLAPRAHIATHKTIHDGRPEPALRRMEPEEIQGHSRERLLAGGRFVFERRW